MEKISQCNRTILFESINPIKYNLLTLIGDTNNISSLEDDVIKEINDKLLVSSFDEFLEKFEPSIYSYYDANKSLICYSLEKPNISEEAITVIRLNKDNTFLNMLLSLIDVRESNKVVNINFDYEDILSYLSPKKIMEDLKQLRQEISYTYEKYLELDNKNPLKLEYADKLNYKFSIAEKSYNNVLALLPLAINDIETRLMLSDNKKTKNSIDKIKTGILSLGSEGNIELLEISSHSDQLQINSSIKNSQNQLSELFSNDYKEQTKNPNDYVAKLVSRTFAPISNDLIEIDVEKEITNYNNYISLYKNSEENFINIAKELIKKIIGVKLFFDQYKLKSKKMTPKLLITNIDTEQLLSSKNKNALETYLNTVNNKNDFSNTIWFSILPNVNYNTEYVNENVKKRFNGSSDVKLNSNSFNTLISLAKTMQKFKISLYFNFEASSKTDFRSLSLNGIDSYISKTKVLENQSYSEYVVATMPNFTLIPKNKSKVLIGNTMGVEDKEIKKLDEIFFYIDGIYIDSSYIAAGLVASMQCPNYLKDRFTNVLNNTPGVRVNIEEGDNAFKIKTTLAKEITGYTENIKNKINELNYGFIFSSDNAIFDNKLIDNITVYKARSMAKNINGTYEPTYKTQTISYIERILRYDTSDFKEERINHFFSNVPDSTKSIWLKNNNSINSILTVEDDISHEIDKENNSFNLNLKLSKEVRHLKLFINAKE